MPDNTKCFSQPWLDFLLSLDSPEMSGGASIHANSTLASSQGSVPDQSPGRPLCPLPHLLWMEKVNTGLEWWSSNPPFLPDLVPLYTSTPQILSVHLRSWGLVNLEEFTNLLSLSFHWNTAFPPIVCVGLAPQYYGQVLALCQQQKSQLFSCHTTVVADTLNIICAHVGEEK